MDLISIKSDKKEYSCNKCCIKPICGSALHLAVEEKFVLPDCQDGKYYFRVSSGNSELWLRNIKIKMLGLLKSLI